MDPIADRAIADYHGLLRDERALAQELEERFFERMRHARLTFGGRVLTCFIGKSATTSSNVMYDGPWTRFRTSVRTASPFSVPRAVIALLLDRTVPARTPD